MDWASNEPTAPEAFEAFEELIFPSSSLLHRPQFPPGRSPVPGLAGAKPSRASTSTLRPHLSRAHGGRSFHAKRDKGAHGIARRMAALPTRGRYLQEVPSSEETLEGARDEGEGTGGGGLPSLPSGCTYCAIFRRVLLHPGRCPLRWRFVLWAAASRDRRQGHKQPRAHSRVDEPGLPPAFLAFLSRIPLSRLVQGPARGRAPPRSLDNPTVSAIPCQVHFWLILAEAWGVVPSFSSLADSI